MGSSTKYNVIANGEALTTKSKKAQAVQAATDARNEHGVDVRVETEAGKVVFELAAPKKIKMSKPYTRVVTLEGVAVPEGNRVCYHRARVGLALLHDPSREKGTQYRFLNTKTGKLVKGSFATTRAAGVAFREANLAKQAQAAQDEVEPATA